jgi:hypothetical protein
VAFTQTSEVASDERKFEYEDQCDSRSRERKGFDKKGCVNRDKLEFVFGDGASLFVTIFAAIFSVLGFVLNLLIIISVVNYRITRRHASIIIENVSIYSALRRPPRLSCQPPWPT